MYIFKVLKPRTVVPAGNIFTLESDSGAVFVPGMILPVGELVVSEKRSMSLLMRGAIVEVEDAEEEMECSDLCGDQSPPVDFEEPEDAT